MLIDWFINYVYIMIFKMEQKLVSDIGGSGRDLYVFLKIFDILEIISSPNCVLK